MTTQAKPPKKSLWKKGQSGNPVGRPKGFITNLKRHSIELRELASQDIHEAYKELREAMQAGEGWAHTIYHKELVFFDKKWLKEVNLYDLKTKLESAEDKSKLTNDLISRILQVESLSVDEVQECVKLLNSINFNELFATNTNLLDELDAEQKQQIVAWILQKREEKEKKLLEEKGKENE